MSKNKNDISEPLVSVIIPTYKRPIFLPRAIESVEKSTWKNTEVIVVDDNTSGDEYRKETEEVMTNIQREYSNIIYLKHEVNKNGSAARNTGLRKASGKYVMFLDDDDVFLPEKISAQVQYLESHGCDWGACYTKYIDKKDGKISAVSAERAEGDLLVKELARNLFVHAGSNLMVRRDIALELNGFDESFLRNQDVEFLVRILKKYKLGYVDVTGLVVNLHPRKYKISYYDLTEQYLTRFKADIDALDKQDKDAVLRMIGLQLTRQALQNRHFSKIKNFKKQYDINNLDIIMYLSHLTGRLLSHKAYSYPMDNLYKRGRA